MGMAVGLLFMIRVILIMRIVIPLMFMTMIFLLACMDMRISVFMGVLMDMGMLMLMAVLLDTVMVRVFMSMLVLMAVLMFVFMIAFHSLCSPFFILRGFAFKLRNRLKHSRSSNRANERTKDVRP